MNFNKNLSPNSWTLINSTAIIFAFFIIYLLSSLIFRQSVSIWPLIISAAAIFSLSWYLYNYILRKFIYSRIKLIYKTIHTLKSPRNGKSKEMIDLRRDVIDDVDQEVLLWAQDKKEEIDELKKMEAYRREFLGNVSHELKTPLFNIQGYTLTLLDGGLNDPAVNMEYLQRIRKNIDRMTSIVEDLQTISGFETGEMQLQIRKFDILALTYEVVEMLEIKAKKKNIKLKILADYEKPILVDGDKERIRQVLINLVDNSLKYGNDGGKTKVSFFDMDENMLIEVADDGIGIDEKDIPRLFERFFRVDKSRSREQGGSGLGLAIVKHIIEAHGQTVNVRSATGVGTTFGFTLKKG